MRTFLRAAGLAFIFALAMPAFASAQTVVSLEFDDGTADQTTAGTILQGAGMPGTFFINSGRIGASGYMTLSQIQALAAAGNEIGGHTVTHADLPTLSTDEAARQICNDRVALLADGFAVSDLAYPYGDTDAAVEQIAANCGYNSARTIGGIKNPFSCSGCDLAETIPPGDPYDTQTPNSIIATETLAQIEGLVTQAPSSGWVQLVMHHICAQSDPSCDPTYAIDPTTLSAFVAWLKPQVASGALAVKTVHQVMGGTVKPGVPGPAIPQPGTGNLLQDPSLENVVTDPNFNNGLPIPSCWQLGQSGTNNGTGAVTTDAHSGVSAEKVSITSFSSGDERLLSQEDLGGCAPEAQAGHSYTFSTWYHSTAPLTMEAYLRSSSGDWGYWADNGGATPAATSYTQASWTTPAVPASGVFDASDNLSCPCTGIAVAVSLRHTGTFTADDLSLTDTDTTAPAVTLTAPANGATVSGNVTLSANASDASGIREVDFLLNGQVIGTSTTPPYQMTWNSAGSTTATIAARATDTAGNVATSPAATVTVTQPDTTPPTVGLNSPVAGAQLSGNATLQATASDNVAVAKVDFFVDGSTLIGTASTSPYQVSFNTATVADGAHTVTAKATDTSGNTTTTSPVSVNVDNTAPTSKATAPASSSSSPFTVSYTAADNTGGSGLTSVDLYAEAPGASTYSKVASDTSGNASGTFSYTASAGNGAYNFYTRATDKAGNVEAAPATADATTTLTVTVPDTTPPSSTASSPASSTSANWTVSYTASDNTGGSGLASVDLYAEAPGASTYSKVASDTSGNASGTFSYTASAGNGAYNFYTRATDKAGNVEAAPATADATTTLTVTVPDTTPPSSTASSPASSTSANWTVSYTASDNTGGSGLASVDLYAEAPGASTYSKVASDTSGNASGTFSYTASAGNGAYNFYTRATDKAGNVEAAPATADATTTLTVSTSTPLSAVSIATANLVGGTKGKFEKGDSITFTYSEQVKPSTVLAGWTGAAQAVHVNVDGNSTTNSVLTVWTMKGTTELPLGSVALGGIYNKSAEFQFNATMVQNGASITLTLGAKHSGQQMTTAVKGGTVTWTPSAAVTDAAGNKASTTAVSTPGPAF